MIMVRKMRVKVMVTQKTKRVIILTIQSVVLDIMRVKYRKAKPAKGKDEKIVTLQVPLPDVMINHKVDMFLIRMDPKTQKTDIKLLSNNVTDTVNLKFKSRKDKNQFFVVIEPTTPYCIYNKI